MLKEYLFSPAAAPPGVLGCVGRAAKDFFFPHAHVGFGRCEVPIRLRSASFCARAENPVFPGRKVPAIIPPGLWSLCGDVRLGGGALNFCRTSQLVAPDVPLRYIDACAYDAGLAGELECLRTGYDFLDLRLLPPNAVFGAADDRTILKTPVQPASKLTPTQREVIAMLKACVAVVAQSIGDVPVMEAVLDICAANSLPMIAAATPSLPADFLRTRVLPAAEIIFCSSDEFSHISGFAVESTASSAIDGLRWLSERLPRAVVFLTLGGRGVLAAFRGEALHVCLNGRRSAEVQSFVSRDPSAVSGCGDAFSAGATLDIILGRSLAFSAGSSPSLSRAAVSGSAAALRWLGFAPRLGPGDFFVRPLALRHPALFVSSDHRAG
jgi:sugar/nucleoside kinase (ribokinase family)